MSVGVPKGIFVGCEVAAPEVFKISGKGISYQVPKELTKILREEIWVEEVHKVPAKIIQEARIRVQKVEKVPTIFQEEIQVQEVPKEIPQKGSGKIPVKTKVSSEVTAASKFSAKKLSSKISNMAPHEEVYLDSTPQREEHKEAALAVTS